MPLDDLGIAQLLEQQGTALKELRETHEQALKKRDAGDVVVQEKLAKINAALDTIEGRVSQAETAAARPRRGEAQAADLESRLEQHNRVMGAVAQRRGETPVEHDADHMRTYKQGFMRFVRQGKDRLSAEHTQAMSVGSDADGGYTVPADMTGRLVQRVYDLSPIRQISAVMAIGSDALEGLLDNDEAGVAWVGETDPRTETGTPTLGKYRIAVEEMYAYPRLTQKLLDDSAVDIEGWLNSKVGDRMARFEGTAFTVGDGMNKPRGFATYTTAATADGARAWGVLEHISTGVNGAFAAGATAPDVLINLVEAVKDGYREGCRWVTRRSVISLIRLFKEATTNAYIWQPGLQQGQPPTLLGYPVTKAEDMPALAAGSLSMAFGNFAEGYQIVDRLGLRVVRDNITQPGFVKFYIFRRTGGAVLNSEAIKFVRFGT